MTRLSYINFRPQFTNLTSHTILKWDEINQLGFHFEEWNWVKCQWESDKDLNNYNKQNILQVPVCK